MTDALTRTQIDRLGDRLRRGSRAEDDLRILDEYRRSFGQAYAAVVQTVREQLRLEPTGRPAKSTGALVEKLHRESIRLVQVQDIAGCRVVVANVSEQDRVVEALRGAFEKASVVDRRTNPSYGYRAVHVIVEVSGKFLRESLLELEKKLTETRKVLGEALNGSISEIEKEKGKMHDLPD